MSQTINTFFAGVLGISEKEVSASATATWEGEIDDLSKKYCLFM